MSLDIVIPILGFGRAGGFRVLSKLGTEWVRAGHRVRFLCRPGGPPPYFPTEAEVVHYQETTGRVRTLPTFAMLGAMRRALSTEAREADLVLANHNMTAWPVATARLRGRRGYYIQAYEPDFFSDQTGPRAVLFRNLARGSYYLPLQQVVNAPVYVDYPGIRATEWVPPGVDLSLFQPRPQPSDGPVPVMGCIGRHEPWKGTADVVAAYQVLRERGEQVRLRIAYHVPETVGLPEGAELVVPANDEELAGFYRSLDVQVAPGTVQFGAPHYPVIEAMACGVPVVTTGYLPATPQNAWLVPSNDPAAVADAVLSVLREPETTRERREAALEAVQPLAWPRVAAQLLAAYGL